MSKMSWPSGRGLSGHNPHASGSNSRSIVPWQTHGRVGDVRPPLSFIFVVNEISIAHTMVDMWGGSRPPENPAAYHSERCSLVMKYQDGHVTICPDYFYWSRDPTQNNRGAIFTLDFNGNIMQTETYKTATIFSCHPHMPFTMVDVDASVERTYNKQETPQDQFRPYPVWEPLQFLHPKDKHLRGISQVVFGTSPDATRHNGPLHYVAGKNASCIPRLIPPTYQHPYPGPTVVQSRGLGGELTILIGLMAFFSKIGSTGARSELFIPKFWSNNKWECARPPQGYSRSTKETPKGFIISVALDPENRLGSTPEALRAFEFNGVVIGESAPSMVSRF